MQRRRSSGSSRASRRYSIRIGLAAIEPVGRTVNPSQVETWNASWAAAFNQFQQSGIDGGWATHDVQRECLPEILTLIGHHTLEDTLVQSALEQVSSSRSSFSAQQVFEFIERYEASLQLETRRLFTASSEKNGGKLPIHEVDNLVKMMGYTPVPHSIRQVLEEAAQELNGSIGDGVTLAIFERFQELLLQHEGFCKSDREILEGAFQRFDKDKIGVIDAQELPAILESVDFCLFDGVVSLLTSQQGNEGKLTWKDFLRISRTRLRLQFGACKELFEKWDDDQDGFLKPGELMRMLSRIGVSLLPETLFDIAEECEVHGQAIDFEGCWKMLHVLRSREGFSLADAADIHEVYERFDSTGRGEMPLKRVADALAWLGYPAGPGVIGKANKEVESPSTGSSYMTEAQFMKLARKHREAQLRAIRKVYRTFAREGGAGTLHIDNLQAAITRLNRLFINDFLDWIKKFKPAAGVARKHVSFDYEEFRIIVLHCCDKLRERVQRNCGYSEIQLSKLLMEFVKYTKEGSSTEVDATGLVKLFKLVMPQTWISPTARSRLRSALAMFHAPTSGLDWHTFLRVIRTYDDLTEILAEEHTEAAIFELQVPDGCIDRAQEILSHLCLRELAPSTTVKLKTASLTSADLLFLVQGIAPGLTEEEVKEALDRLHEAERETVEGEFSVVESMKLIVMSGDLSKRSEHSRAHDIMGTSF